MRRALAMLLLMGCGEELKPETLVTSLRVLSIVSEPPEIHPGQSTALSILELDPSRPGGVTTVIWVGCDPDPFGLGRSACNDTSALLMPTSFTTFPPGVKVLGIGPKSTYSTAATLFDPLTADDPIRQNGVVGQILAVVIGDYVDPTSTDAQLKDLFTKIEHQEIASVYALTRISVTERMAMNQNPHLDGVTADGTALPTGGTLQVEAGQQVRLHVTGGDRETYSLITPDGTLTNTESLVGAWYSSAGRFDQARFDLDTGSDTVFTAPGSPDIPEDPVPDKRGGTVWLVLRDDRGGQAFSTIPFFVCDDSLPAPMVTMVTTETTTVAVSGSNLTSILDVVAGGIALPRGGFNGSVYRADLPPSLASGSYPVTVRTKACKTVDTGLMLTVP
jgi:hypothetical protein